MTKLIAQLVYVSFGMVVVLGCGASDVSGMQVQIQTIALSGTRARATPSDVLIERIESMRVFGTNSSTIFSNLSGPSVNEDNDHLLVDAGGDFSAREGNAARGAPAGLRYGEIDPNFASIPGGTAFRSTIIGDGIDDVAIFLNFSMIVRTGEIAFESELGTTFSNFSSPIVFSQRNSVLVRVELAGPLIDANNSQAIYALGDGEQRLIARAGDQVPSTPAGVTFATFDDPASDNGFRATVTGPGIDESSDEIVLYRLFSRVELLATEGDSVTETSVLGAIGPISSSPGEGLAFRAEINGGEQPGVGIFGASSNRLDMIALSGRIAPGTSGAARFLDFSNPVLDRQGSAAFVARLDFDDGLVQEGIYFERFFLADELIMRTGDPVSGLGDNVRIASFASETLTRGAGAFVAFLEGDAVDATNNQLLLARNRIGDMVPIVRTGDAIDVSRNSGIQDVRTIQSIQFDAGRRLQLNDNGTLGFELSFTDGGNGIFVVDALGPIGDFNADGEVDADDIDLYAGNIRQPASVNARLDLDNDGIITLADRDFFVTTLVQTSNGLTGALIGDIDLDGTVNVLGDTFILIGNLGGVGLGYADGDLNSDGFVTVLADAFRLVGNLGQSNE